ncbi:MAG: heme ABC transporter ATP-binding protein [Gammaproteobacteria bacterium]|nr:heme ABC transporter ATP-binding protein [Gammaproteobacteria bacterium]
MLEMSQVSYQVGEKWLLDSISLCIQPGEMLALLGQNGAGKSTLLKVLSGECQPASGAVTLSGQPLQALSTNRLAKQRAVLPQKSRLNFPFKVLQVAMMGRSPYRGERYKASAEVVYDALKATGTAHLSERVFTTLSGGEQQRVHLARVLAQIWQPSEDNQARYLLLDEPTSALDLIHQHSVLAVAKKFAHEAHVGVLAVLHDLNLAAYYADRVAILRNGKMLCQGEPFHVLTPATIYHAFGAIVKVIRHPERERSPLVIWTDQTESQLIKADKKSVLQGINKSA